MDEVLNRRKFLIATASAGIVGSALLQTAEAAREESSYWAQKHVLITGATSGLGRAMALFFAKKGARVSFCGRRREKGSQVEKEIKKNGGIGKFYQADIIQETQVREFIDGSATGFGPIHLAINNAGIDYDSDKFGADSMENHIRVIQTNLIGTMLCLKYEVSQMLKNNSGNIINIGSVAAVRGSANGVSYSASKHGVLGLTRSLAKNLGAKGIRVNMISPYRLNHDMDGTDNLVDEKNKDIIEVKNKTPTGKLITIEEIVEAAAWIGSQSGPSYTGQNMILDGAALA